MLTRLIVILWRIRSILEFSRVDSWLILLNLLENCHFDSFRNFLVFGKSFKGFFMVAVHHVSAHFFSQKRTSSHLGLLWSTHSVCQRGGQFWGHGHLHAHFVCNRVSWCGLWCSNDSCGKDSSRHIFMRLKKYWHRVGCFLCLFPVGIFLGCDRWKPDTLVQSCCCEQTHLPFLRVEALLGRSQGERTFFGGVWELHFATKYYL